MTPATPAKAPALLLAAMALAGLFVASDFTASAQGEPVEQNCTPPTDEGEWIIENTHVVCVGRDITLSRLQIWKASTVELHDVNLYLDTAKTPAGKSTVRVGDDIAGYAVSSKFLIQNSHVDDLAPQFVATGSDGISDEGIAIGSHGILEFTDSTLAGFHHGIVLASQATEATITSSTFKDLEFGITDFGAPDVVIQHSFFDEINSPIYTQGTPLIEGNTIVNCKGSGILFKFDSAHPVVRENTITGCGRGMGQSQSQSPQEDIYHNDVFGNCNPEGSGSNAKFWGTGEENWWGNSMPRQDEMYGKYKCVVEPAKAPNFDYTPWLTSPRHPERLPTPSIASLPSSVVRGESITFDASGSQPSTEFGFPITSYEWSFGDGATAVGQQVTHAYQDLGTYTVRLHVRDEKGLGHFAQESVQVVNQDPEVEVSLSSGHAGEAIEAAVTAVDPDGEAPGLSYSWRRNGQLEGDLMGASVPGSRVHSLDTWSVTVTATDADGGTAQAMNQVVIPNQAPQVSGIVVEPASPHATDDLRVVATASDADKDDVVLSYAWRRNGALQSDLVGDMVPSGRVRSMDAWSVTVTARDVHGATGSGTAEVVVPNRAPEITSLSLVPDAPRRGDSLRVVASTSDADGDVVSRSYAWYRDGVLQEGSSSVVSGDGLRRGESWSVVVSASDGHEEVTRASDVVQVQNTAPRITRASLLPVHPLPGQELRVDVVGFDADEDAVTYSFVWRRNGQLRPELAGATVPGSWIQEAGEVWQATVTPHDGRVVGDAVVVQAVIGNQAPRIEDVHVLPELPRTGDVLEAFVEAVDPDGDALTYAYSWSRNGEVQSVSDAVVPEEWVVKGDAWSVSVTVTDGKSSFQAASPHVTIQNTPPTITAATATPMQPLVGEATELVVEAIDSDGDALDVAWEVGDSQWQGSRIEATFLAPGNVEILYHVTDGDATASGVLEIVVHDMLPEPDVEASTNPEPAGGGVEDGLDPATPLQDSTQSNQATETRNELQDHPDDLASAPPGASRNASGPGLLFTAAALASFLLRRRL